MAVSDHLCAEKIKKRLISVNDQFSDTNRRRCRLYVGSIIDEECCRKLRLWSLARILDSRNLELLEIVVGKSNTFLWDVRFSHKTNHKLKYKKEWIGDFEIWLFKTSGITNTVSHYGELSPLRCEQKGLSSNRHPGCPNWYLNRLSSTWYGFLLMCRRCW